MDCFESCQVLYALSTGYLPISKVKIDVSISGDMSILRDIWSPDWGTSPN